MFDNFPNPLDQEDGELAKSSATRRRILDSAIDLLVDDGFANFSVGATAARAGITRAALIYHFANRADLLEATVYYVMRRMLMVYRKSVAGLEDNDQFFKNVIDIGYKELRSNPARAFRELATASLTNPELRRVFRPAALEFERVRRTLALSAYPEPLTKRRSFEFNNRFGRFVLDGLVREQQVIGVSHATIAKVKRLIELLHTTEEGRRLVDKAASTKASSPAQKKRRSG